MRVLSEPCKGRVEGSLRRGYPLTSMFSISFNHLGCHTQQRTLSPVESTLTKNYPVFRISLKTRNFKSFVINTYVFLPPKSFGFNTSIKTGGWGVPCELTPHPGWRTPSASRVPP